MNEQAPNNSDYLQQHPDAEPSAARAHEMAHASKPFVEFAAQMDKLATGLEADTERLSANKELIDSARDVQAHDEQVATQREQEAGRQYDEDQATKV